MRKTKHLKKNRKNKTFKGGSNQSEKQLQINNQMLQNENGSLRNQLLETKHALQSLKQKMRLRDSQDFNNLNAKYQEKISQFNQLTGENKRLKSNMADLESQLNNLIGENKTINLDHEKLKGQHEMLTTENSNHMQSLTTLLNEKDRKIFHLWKIVCNYLNYTNSLHEELNKDISIQNDIAKNLNNRIANKRNFDEWWDRSVKNKIPLCDANINLETWLNTGKSNNIMY